MNGIDWAAIITQVLMAVLPTVATIAVTYLVAQWGSLKKSEKFGQSFSNLEALAHTLIKAAEQLGAVNGWDGQARHDYAFAQLKAAASKLPIKFTDAQLDEILDAVLEGVYGGMKTNQLVEAPAPKG